MIRKPAHKDVLHPPGQVVTSPVPAITPGFDRYPYIPKTLGNMIDDAKKHEEMLMNEKKKTFEQWWGHMYEALNPSDPRRSSLYREMCRAAYKAGQENK